MVVRCRIAAFSVTLTYLRRPHIEPLTPWWEGVWATITIGEVSGAAVFLGILAPVRYYMSGTAVSGVGNA